jgi:hypothetical protein
VLPADVLATAELEADTLVSHAPHPPRTRPAKVLEALARRLSHARPEQRDAVAEALLRYAQRPLREAYFLAPADLRKALDLADWLQEARLRVLEAAERYFDPARGSFAGVLVMVLRQLVSRVIERAGRGHPSLSITDPETMSHMASPARPGTRGLAQAAPELREALARFARWVRPVHPVEADVAGLAAGALRLGAEDLPDAAAVADALGLPLRRAQRVLGETWVAVREYLDAYEGVRDPEELLRFAESRA